MIFPIAMLALGAPPTFTWNGGDFLLNGQPFQVRSGELHYSRIPRAYWKDRLQKAKAMGLNTISATIFWSEHEPEQDVWDFKNNRDLVAFVKEAQKQGLWVIVRPGPYVGAEWDWGGMPYWLAKIDGVKVRQNETSFIRASRNYLHEIGRRLAPLTIARGGPIIMCQVESEYGSFGKDPEYLTQIRDQIQDAGFNCLLYTSDRANLDALRAGSLTDVLSFVDFGNGAKAALDEFAKFRQNVPRMSGEFWAGGYDAWGQDRVKTSAEAQTKEIEWFMANNISFNVSMLHGGTNWGFTNGANVTDKGYQAVTTSYDYDAAIAEDGRLTPKWHAFREAILRRLPSGTKLPEPPADAKRVEISEFKVDEATALDEGPILLRSGWSAFEDLGQPYGFVRYQGFVQRATKGKLEVEGLQDRAIVSVKGKRIGVLDRRQKQTTLDVDLPAASVVMVLVENMGRVGSGSALLSERKGLTAIKLNGKPLTVPYSMAIELNDFSEYRFEKGLAPTEPALYRAKFDVKEVGDTYIDMRGWGKGNVWVNGVNLGRYWSVGPQQTLYCPAPFLKRGKNDIIVLDLEPGKKRTLSGVKDPIWGSS